VEKVKFKNVLMVGIGLFLTLNTSLFSIGIIEKNKSLTWYSNGMYLFEKGKYLKSVECFEKALSINPNNAKARAMMDKVVKMAMQKKKHLQRKHFQGNSTQVSRKPREIVYDSENSFLLANNYLKNVEKTLQTHLGKNNLNFQHLNKYLKNAKGSKMQQEKIAQQMQEAKAQDYNKMGMEYAKKGDFQKAIGLFQKAIQQNPYDVEAHINLGLAYAYSDRLYDAVKEYKMVLKLADKNSREYKIAQTMIEKLKSFI
jgi:tetratricopeptide (TPR) repeat protein